jgi:2-oxoglutarate ferredoxin oxidoreductase subunit beta
MLVPCPTGYGRKNQLREIKANWEWYKKNTILNSKYRILEEKQKDDNNKIVIGELQNIERKEFTFEWANLVKDKYVE